MTLLEAIKKAEEKQKVLGENTTKVYIRRKGWKNVIDPVDFAWMYTLKFPFYKTDIKFKPSKDDVINTDWVLFYSLPKAENKNNKDSKPESTSISKEEKENIINAIEQIALIKKELNFLSKEVTKNREMFEKNYGINFERYIENPKIFIDSESSALYFFVEIVRIIIKSTNTHLNKAVIKLSETQHHKDEK